MGHGNPPQNLESEGIFAENQCLVQMYFSKFRPFFRGHSSIFIPLWIYRNGVAHPKNPLKKLKSWKLLRGPIPPYCHHPPQEIAGLIKDPYRDYEAHHYPMIKSTHLRCLSPGFPWVLFPSLKATDPKKIHGRIRIPRGFHCVV